jgi:hypothetical protein
VIVTEREVREVAVQVKHNISVNINKEIALALLCVDESLDL